jgi:hypothetical protein
VPVGVDIKGLPEAVARMRAIMRMMGLADFLDVNIPVGKLISQIQVIKRLLTQAGVTDLLDVDLNKASLSKAMAEVQGLSTTVDVGFDVSHLPVLDLMKGLAEKVGVEWDIPPLEPELIAATAGDRVDIPVDFETPLLAPLIAAEAAKAAGAVKEVIAEDAERMMTLYRLENEKTGTGPYTSSSIPAMNEAHYDDPEHPGPFQDAIMSLDALGTETMLYGDQAKSAFTSMEQLTRWFGEWLPQLKELGFVVRSFEIPEKDVLQGATQVLYKPPAAPALPQSPAEWDALAAAQKAARDALASAGPAGDMTEKITADTGPAAAAIEALRARMAALSATLTDLRVGLDDAGAVAKIAALQAKLAAIAKFTGSILLRADTSKLDAAIIAEQVKLAALQAQASNIDLYFNTADLAKLDASIAAVQAKIAAMQAQADDIRLAFAVDPAGLAKADAQLLALEALTQKMAAAVIPLKFDVTGLPVGGETVNLTAKIDLSGVNEALTAMGAAAAAADAHLAVLDGSMMAAGLDAAIMARNLAGADAALDIMAGGSFKAAAALAVMGGAIGELNAELDLLAVHQVLAAESDALLAAGNKVQTDSYLALAAAIGMNDSVISGWKEAVAGVVTDSDKARSSILGMAGGAALASAGMMGLMGTFRETAGLMSWAGIIHSIFMLSMEFLAVAIPALIAFGAAADDQLQGWSDMYTRMSAINVVGQSIGQTFGKTDGQILGLGDSLQKAQNAVQTQVYEILGAAISVMSGNIAGATDKTSKFADGFNAMGTSVTKTMDQFAAKVAVDLGTSTEQYIGLINKGAQDLTEFGEILGNVGHAILNFASNMPGLAEIVLKVITGISSLILWVSKLPGPLITVVMAIEEAYRWSGYLAAVFGLVGSAITMLGTLGLPILAAIGANISKMFASVVTGAAGAIANLTRITATVAGGLGFDAAADAIEGAGTGMVTSLTGVAEFLTGPWGIAIGLAVGALVVLGVWISNTKTQTQQWTDSMDSVVQKSEGLAQIGATYGALTAVTQQFTVAQKNVNTVLSNKSAAENTAFAQKEMNEGMGEGTAIAQQYSMALNKAQGQSSVLSAAQKTLTQDFGTENSNVGMLARMYGISYTSAAILAGQANANLTQTMQGNTVAAKNNLQMVKDYVAGLGGMGEISGALGSDIDAVTVDAALQGTQVQKLTTAWSDVMTMVQAPSAGFLGLAQSLETFNSDAQTAGATMTGLGGTVGKVSTTFPKMNSASIQLQQDFNQSASAAQTMIGSLYETAAVTGSNGPLIQGIKDTIAVLIPMAGKNQAAAAQIHVLAQEAFGPGGATMSMSQLAKAVGKTKDPLDNLYKISGQAAGELADLGQDAQNLADTVQTSLNQTLVTAAQALTGVSANTATYLKDLQNLGASSPVTQAALASLNSSVASSNVLAGEAASGVTALSGSNTALGKTTAAQQANRQTLYNDINAVLKKAPGAAKAVSNLTQGIQTQGTTTSALHADRQTLYNDLVALKVPSQTAWAWINNLGAAAEATVTPLSVSEGAFATWAKGGLDLGTSSADALWKKVVGDLGPSLDGMGGILDGSKQKFIDWAHNALGLSWSQASTLYGELQTLQKFIDGMHGTNIDITEKGVGTFSVSNNSTSGPNNKGSAPTSTGAAAGMLVTAGTGPTADDVLARVSKGETIVSAAMSKKLAPLFAKMGVPGYAGGGVVGGGAGALTGETAAFSTGFQQDMTASMETAMTAAMKSAIASAKTAAASAVGGGNTRTGAGDYSYAQLQSLWESVGGPGGTIAQNMAQIAIAECVTIDTVILTKRGWLDYTEVRPGDETIGYNPASGQNEWTRIERVVQYPQQEIWKFGNKYWSVKCTPNHRWLAERVVRHALGPGGERFTGRDVIALEDLIPQQRVILSRPAGLGSELPVTVSEAALLGWIARDGWVSESRGYSRERKPRPAPAPPCAEAPFGYRLDGQPRKGRSGRPQATGPEPKVSSLNVSVCQSKPEHFVAIAAACSADSAVSTYVNPPRRAGYKEGRTWRLSTAYARDLIARAGNPKTDAVNQVLRMSAEQREAWLGAIIAAEGCRTPGKTVVYQNDGPIADAIELAIYLSGKRPSRSKDTREGHDSWRIGITSPYIGGKDRRRFCEPAGHEDVWCVTTTLGTWTAKQGNQVFLTGNSGGNPNAYNASGATGLWQILGAVYPGNLFNPVVNAHNALVKYDAGGYYPWTADAVAAALVASGDTGEGSPGRLHAAAGMLVPGYAQGGMPLPGYAAGGVPSRLAAAQAKEAQGYSSAARQVSAALAAGAAGARKAETQKELARLVRDQSYETGAFGDLASGGLTAGNLSWFRSQLQEMQSEAAAKDIARIAPGALGTLGSELGTLLSLAAGTAATAGSGSSGGKTAGTPATPAVASSAATKKMTAGQIAKQGAAYLKAFRGQEINPKIDWWNAELRRDSALAGASGLSKVQARHYKAAAAADKKMIAALTGEKTVMQEWRADLGSSDSSLSSWISAAGKTPSLAKNVTQWKKSLAGQEKTIAEISAMLGWSAAQVAAQKAAAAAGAAAAGSSGDSGSSSSSGGTTTITPVGLTPAGALAAYISGIAGTGAKVTPGFGGSFDNGGTLSTGWNVVHNGTGRPEPLVPGRRSANGVSPDTAAITARLDTLIAAMQQNTAVAGSQGTQLGRALNSAAQPPAKKGPYSASLRRLPM